MDQYTNLTVRDQFLDCHSFISLDLFCFSVFILRDVSSMPHMARRVVFRVRWSQRRERKWLGLLMQINRAQNPRFLARQKHTRTHYSWSIACRGEYLGGLYEKLGQNRVNLERKRRALIQNLDWIPSEISRECLETVCICRYVYNQCSVVGQQNQKNTRSSFIFWIHANALDSPMNTSLDDVKLFCQRQQWWQPKK